MPKRPGSIRPVKKFPTFVVTKKEEHVNDTFTSPVDSIPKAVEAHKKVVYCNVSSCVFNQPIEELTHTETVVRNGNNPNSSDWKPLSPRLEKVWNSVCTREEVVIDMKTILGAGGSKRRVPGCHTSWETGRSGHVDFSKRMGEAWSIDDNTDPKAMDEGMALQESPFYGNE